MNTFWGILVVGVMVAVLGLAMFALHREELKNDQREKFIDELRKRESERTTEQANS